jgi:hypothetical protein
MSWQTPQYQLINGYFIATGSLVGQVAIGAQPLGGDLFIQLPNAAPYNVGDLLAVSAISGSNISLGFISNSGQSGGNVPNFSDAETPAGVIDGFNATFTLAHIPNPAASLILVENGQVLSSGIDFTLSGSTIAIFTAPVLGSDLAAWYRF